MKNKAIFFVILMLLSASLFAGTEYRDQCRGIIYANQPVDAISAIDDTTLRTLARYALMGTEGQDPLNNNDQYLFSWLANTELARRQRNADQFTLYLQERREALAAQIKAGDNQAIRIDGWIDIYRLNLIFSN